MKLNLDLKSMLLGFCIGLLTVLAIGASISPNPVGKYQVAGTASYFVIVDTTTGKAWLANFILGTVKHTDADFFQPKE